MVQPEAAIERSGLLEKAAGLAAQGRFAAARQVFQAILDVAPDDPVALHQAALVNFNEGRRAPAVRLMYRALRSEPDDYRHYWVLGRMLAANGEQGWGLVCLAQALRMSGGGIRGARRFIGEVLAITSDDGPVSVDCPKPISYIREHLLKSDVRAAKASDVPAYCRDNGARLRAVLPETERAVRGFWNLPGVPGPELGRVTVPAAYVAEIHGGMVTNGAHLLLGSDFTVLSDRFASPIWKGLRNDWVDTNYYRTLAFFSTAKRRFIALLVGRLIDAPVPEGISLLARTDLIWTNWVVEVLPRLMLVDHFPEYDGLPLLVNKNVPQQALEALEMVNTKRREVVLIDSHWKGKRTWIPTTYRFERLVFPSPMAQLGPKTAGEDWDLDDHLQNPAALQWLREKLLPSRTASRRIYLSRAKQGRRRIVNEKQLVALLRRHRFEVVYPERLSFKEQLELWANSEVVVGPAGSAMVNMVFAPRHAVIIALLGDMGGTNMYLPAQWATELELQLILMEGHCENVGATGIDWNTDFSVDLERLEAILRDAPSGKLAHQAER